MADKFDVALAQWVFYSQNHEGQASEFYRRLSRVSESFQPSSLFSEEVFFDATRREEDYAEARECYSRLCAKHGVEDPFQSK